MDKLINASDDAEKTPKKGRFQGVQLVVVQCSICIFTVLIVLALKFVGGNAYVQLQSLFRNAMTSGHVLEGVLASAEISEEHTDTAQPDEAVTENAVAPTFYPPLENGVLTSSFGGREDPFDGSVSDVHHGVDIAADEGAALAALTDGVVSEVGYNESGYGHYILVDCENGQAYLYAHCCEILAKQGERVVGGQTIALVGNTGRSTGSHVHIEWREDGQPIDPMTVLPRESYV